MVMVLDDESNSSLGPVKYWESPGNTAWFVSTTHESICYIRYIAEFWNTVFLDDLEVTGNIYYITDRKTGKGGCTGFTRLNIHVLSLHGQLSCSLYYGGSG